MQRTLQLRGEDPQQCDVHVGFDGGQDLLKIAYTVTKRTGEEKSGRSRYSDVRLLVVFCIF